MDSYSEGKIIVLSNLLRIRDDLEHLKLEELQL